MHATEHAEMTRMWSSREPLRHRRAPIELVAYSSPDITAVAVPQLSAMMEQGIQVRCRMLEVNR